MESLHSIFFKEFRKVLAEFANLNFVCVTRERTNCNRVHIFSEMNVCNATASFMFVHQLKPKGTFLTKYFFLLLMQENGVRLDFLVGELEHLLYSLYIQKRTRKAKQLSEMKTSQEVEASLENLGNKGTHAIVILPKCYWNTARKLLINTGAYDVDNFQHPCSF